MGKLKEKWKEEYYGLALLVVYIATTRLDGWFQEELIDTIWNVPSLGWKVVFQSNITASWLFWTIFSHQKY